jgi:hypothetical protein
VINIHVHKTLQNILKMSKRNMFGFPFVILKWNWFIMNLPRSTVCTSKTAGSPRPRPVTAYTWINERKWALSCCSFVTVVAVLLFSLLFPCYYCCCAVIVVVTALLLVLLSLLLFWLLFLLLLCC